MNTEKIKNLLKKTRDFILCCRKTMDQVEDIIDEFDDFHSTGKIYNPK